MVFIQKKRERANKCSNQKTFSLWFDFTVKLTCGSSNRPCGTIKTRWNKCAPHSINWQISAWIIQLLPCQLMMQIFITLYDELFFKMKFYCAVFSQFSEIKLEHLWDSWFIKLLEFFVDFNSMGLITNDFTLSFIETDWDFIAGYLINIVSSFVDWWNKHVTGFNIS